MTHAAVHGFSSLRPHAARSIESQAQVFHSTKAISVGPVETWQAEKVSIWHAGRHDNPFGQRLTTLMISKKIPDAAVPMSLLADHPNVQFNFYRAGIGTCGVEMH